MKATARVGERGQVVIPKQMRDELAIGKDTSLEFELNGRVLTLRPKKDVETMRRAWEKYKGSQRKQFKADGFTSTEHFMQVVRGR